MDNKDIPKILNQVADQLGEHFDAVQILVTRMAPEGKGTERYSSGSGNWYARQGMAHAFIKCDEADTFAHEMGKKLAPPPDDSETWKEKE
jgi:hypothetical protein